MRYAAERRNLDESIEEQRQIGAAMMILAGGGRGFPLDYDELSVGRASAMSGG